MHTFEVFAPFINKKTKYIKNSLIKNKYMCASCYFFLSLSLKLEYTSRMSCMTRILYIYIHFYDTIPNHVSTFKLVSFILRIKIQPSFNPFFTNSLLNV